MAKHKYASISLTVRDRVISLNFSTHRVSKECTLCNLQQISPPQKWWPTGYLRNVIFAIFKKFPLLKNGGHFEFSPKMAKHKFASISLTVRDRAISSKFSTHRVSEHCTLGNFQKNFPLPKNGGHFEFSNFSQKWQNTKLLLSH